MNQLPNDTGVVIVDHGSKRPEANQMLTEVVRMYRLATGAEIVEAAHMELAEPSIAQAVERCVEQGAQRVVVCLFFLSPGRHARADIPEMVRTAATEHGIPYDITDPLGVDPYLIGLMHKRVLESVATPV